MAAANVAFSAPASPQPYRTAPPAPWIQVAGKPDLAAGKPVEEGESDYLLVDNQVRLSAVTEHYYRIVERLTNQDAVDSRAQISIELDPQYERVLLHQVRVFRNGRAIDKLADARRSLLNRESGLEEGLIDGRVTLHVLLRDIRVGDVLDFSYTEERRDPFGERGYYAWFTTQWSDPTRRLRLRVLRPQDRPLQIGDHGKLDPPTVTQSGGWIDTTWQGENIAALPAEKTRPGWYFFRPRIELSEFASWNAVRAWAEPLYAIHEKSDSGLRALLKELAAEPDESRRVLRALRFVQDDVRYTGIEIGAGAYRPTQPDTVFSRRYGDCKDKVLLLVTLLRELGVEAWPALVHSSTGRGLAERLPSPGAFNHVIAKVILGSRVYWLDATASGQGGDLNTLVQADLGPALVLDGSEHGLQLMPARQGLKPNQRVIETYDLRKGREQAATFRVHTVYREEEADAMRVKMRSTTASKLGKQYLEYYRKRYPGIRMLKPVVLKDERTANVYSVDEDYEIAKPFKKKGDKWKFYFRAYLILNDTDEPEQGERTAPLARDFPLHVRHEIVAYLPKDWDVDEEVVKISDPAFEYRSEVKFRKGRLDLTYDLRHTADHVPAQSIAEFARKLEEMDDDAYFSVIEDDQPTPLVAAAATPPSEPKGVSPMLISALLAGLVGGMLFSILLVRRPALLPAARSEAPVGVEGWLLVPFVLLFAQPFAMFNGIWDLLVEYGPMPKFARAHGITQGLLVARAFVMSASLVLAFTGLWLLWKRARTFPRLFNAVLAMLVLFAVLGAAVVWQEGFLTRSPSEEIVGVGEVIVLAALLFAYMARSQRVRATFVNGRDTTPLAATPG